MSRCNLQKAFLRHEIPGLSAAVRSLSGTETLFALGWSDRALAEQLTAQHRMSTGSVGKTFTAATALALAQQKQNGSFLNGTRPSTCFHFWMGTMPAEQSGHDRALLGLDILS